MSARATSVAAGRRADRGASIDSREVFHRPLSEHAAYGRIEAARAVRRYPIVLEMLEAGALNLTSVGLLRQHLTPENHREVLASAAHRGKREVEELVARLRPSPELPSNVRRLPLPRRTAAEPSNVAIAPSLTPPVGEIAEREGPTLCVRSRPATVKAVAPERYRIQITVGRETHERFRRVQDLMRHTVPNGDPAEIFDRALAMLLEDLERSKIAVTNRPRQATSHDSRSRYIPAAVRRAVWTRDAARCAFVGTDGRCAETGFLEFHHVRPHPDEGPATIENIELRCRAHNTYEADLLFGADAAREGLLELGPD